MPWILLFFVFLGTGAARGAERTQDEQSEQAGQVEEEADAPRLFQWWSDWQARRQLTPPPTVRDIHFEEQDMAPRLWPLRWTTEAQRMYRGTNDSAVRTAMEQSESPLLTFTDARRALLDEELLEEDAYRVEIWYAHHGYFDARHEGWEVRQVKPPPVFNALRPKRLRRGPVLELVGHVDPGPESKITSVRVEGIEELTRTVVLPIQRAEEALLDASFSLEAPETLAKTIELELHNRGYARATAQTEIIARPEEQAVEVVITVDPGPVCVFGEVEILGLVDVPEATLLDRITITPGERYEPSELSLTHAALFGMGTFSVVQVVPDLESQGAVIPIQIVVTETLFRELLIGGGGAAGGGALEARARTRFEHNNMFGMLLQSEVDLTAGYKLFPSSVDSAGDIGDNLEVLQAGPFANLDAGLYYPHLGGNRKWSARPSGSLAWVRERSSVYKSGQITPAVSWSPFRGLVLSPSYSFKYIWDLDYSVAVPEELDFLACPDDRTQNCTYNLQYAKIRVILDRRSPSLQPTHGSYLEVSAALAGAGLVGDFDFYRLTTDFRHYQAYYIREHRVILAGRVVGGLAQPYGGDPARAQVPLPERFLLGGSTSVRGFSEDLLGPRECSSKASGASIDNCYTTLNRTKVNFSPLGGQAMTHASLEARIRVASDTDVVVFSDVGGNWASLDQVALDGLQPTAGLGLRFGTPAGPLRLDFGYRLKQDPEYRIDRRYGVYLSIQEAF